MIALARAAPVNLQQQFERVHHSYSLGFPYRLSSDSVRKLSFWISEQLRKSILAGPNLDQKELTMTPEARYRHLIRVLESLEAARTKDEATKLIPWFKDRLAYTQAQVFNALLKFHKNDFGPQDHASIKSAYSNLGALESAYVHFLHRHGLPDPKKHHRLY